MILEGRCGIREQYQNMPIHIQPPRIADIKLIQYGKVCKLDSEGFLIHPQLQVNIPESATLSQQMGYVPLTRKSELSI
jgi:hypothetical protein